MSDASTFPEAGRRRLARTLGVVALLLVQGGCGLLYGELLRRQHATQVARPTRAANRQALERIGTAALVFPSAGGMIDWFDDDTIVVMSITGTRVRVRVDHETLYIRPDGSATPSDLYPGADVLVSGEIDPDGSVLADIVLVTRP
jgi:hypothetical protein